MNDPNKLTPGDYAHSMAKAGLGSIPIFGATASELFGLIVSPPLEKRRRAWMEEMSNMLKELQEKGKVDLSNLASNEQFIDVVLTSTSHAMKTSEQEKIKAFQNAISNVALGECPDKTRSQIFLHLLDTFTVWHIKILHFIDNPQKWFEVAGHTPPTLLSGSLFSVLKTAFPELNGQDELTDLIWKDLHDSGLHKSTDLKTMMNGGGLMGRRSSELGRQFLIFISSPAI